MSDDLIVGLECHLTINKGINTKLFCGCPLPPEDIKPNTYTCPVCLALPGAKPKINKEVIKAALKLALALNCDIQDELVFSRKVYFYPDSPNNYQRTQYEIPLGKGGYIELDSGKKIRLIRVHVEEDPGASLHKGQLTLVDYNRAGMPLCEIVTEPDMNSPEEAREFLKKLITIVNYLHIFDNVTGTIKADTNVSIKGHERIEIKNVSGFKEIEKAIVFESERQRGMIKDGNPISSLETRGWDSEKGITVFQRKKESESDYGYIIDADLVPIEIRKILVDKIRKELPELPQDKVKRYIKELKLKKDDAKTIANDYNLAQVYDGAVKKKIDPLFAAEWIRREVVRVLNYNKKELNETFITKGLIDVLELIKDKKITRQTGQKIMEKLIFEDLDVKKYVKEEGLGAVSDTKALESIVKKIIDANSKAVEEFKSGNEKSFNFLVGQVMRETKGQADPIEVNELVKKTVCK